MNFASFNITQRLATSIERLNTKHPIVASIADGAVLGCIVGTVINTAVSLIDTVVEVL